MFKKSIVLHLNTLSVHFIPGLQPAVCSLRFTLTETRIHYDIGRYRLCELY